MYYTLKGYWSRIWTVNPYRGSTHGHPKLSLIFSDRSHCRGLPAEISILPTWIVPDRIFKYLEQELVQPSSGRRNSNTTIPHETDAIIAEHEILDAKKTKGAISPLSYGLVLTGCSAAGVMLRVQFFHPLTGHMCVNLRSRQITMSEQHLHNS